LISVLIDARKSNGIGQEGLSKKLGQGRNFVQKIEYKERRIDVVEFFQFANALEIDPMDLFGRFIKRTKSESQ
jgi:transcriptional regulator with XRE-family HTH domain